MFENYTFLLIFCKQTAENVNKIFENQENCIFLKRILALPTMGQKSFVSKIWPFPFATFDFAHPVCQFSKKWNERILWSEPLFKVRQWMITKLAVIVVKKEILAVSYHSHFLSCCLMAV